VKRKTLFSKIFFMQMSSALTTIVIIIPTVFFIIGNYFVGEQKDDILQDAVRVATLSEQIADFRGTEAEWEFYRFGVEFASRQSKIIVVNKDGEIIASAKDIGEVDLSEITESFIEPVKNGGTAVKLYPKGKIFSEQTLVAMAPITKKNPISGERSFIGATIAMRTLPHIRYIRDYIIMIILCAQVVAWILAFVISSIFARRITKPIKKMREAAKSIATGNYKEKIPITSQDEIGQLAESFNEMTESLFQLETMRSSFISDVSHELRTPMTIISGFVEGILDGTIPEEKRKQYLDIVLSEIKRLSRLVSELLESSRLEQGKVNLKKENIDLNRIVAESLISYENAIAQKKIDVDLELDGHECIAFADKDSIKRVMINLIDNAIKFTPEEGKIFLRTEASDKKVTVCIENSGEGIAPEELKHIWERFYKTDKSRSMDKRGVGLGLHIVKTIISYHGGEIRAESEQGKYARFIFSLDGGSKNSV